MSTNHHISDELLASFIDGKTSVEESFALLQEMNNDSQLFQEFRIASQASQLVEMSDETIIVDIQYPNVQVAAYCKMVANTSEQVDNNESHVCAIQSEQFILSKFGIDVSLDDLIEIAFYNGWFIRKEGTPQRFVGNLCSHFGLTVVRSNNANMNEMEDELRNGAAIILCVDSGELIGDSLLEIQEDKYVGEIADHVVVVDSISADSISVIDPATPQHVDTYSMAQFTDAWEDSDYYCVIVKSK